MKSLVKRSCLFVFLLGVFFVQPAYAHPTGFYWILPYVFFIFVLFPSVIVFFIKLRFLDARYPGFYYNKGAVVLLTFSECLILLLLLYAALKVVPWPIKGLSPLLIASVLLALLVYFICATLLNHLLFLNAGKEIPPDRKGFELVNAFLLTTFVPGLYALIVGLKAI